MSWFWGGGYLPVTWCITPQHGNLAPSTGSLGDEARDLTNPCTSTSPFYADFYTVYACAGQSAFEKEQAEPLMEGLIKEFESIEASMKRVPEEADRVGGMGTFASKPFRPRFLCPVLGIQEKSLLQP